MLTQREMFKVAFLEQCAQSGLTLEETEEVAKEALARINGGPEKEAFIGGLARGAGAAFKGLAGLGAAAIPAALALGVGIPAATGGAAGYALGRGKGGLSDDDVKQEKDRELIDAYRQAAERAQSKSRIRRRKRVKPNIVRSLI